MDDRSRIARVRTNNMAGSKTRDQRATPSVGADGLEDRLERLASAINEVRAGQRLSPRTIKLLKSGVPKMAQKVIEEAAELGIEAVRGNRNGVIEESVDLLYNVFVLWSQTGVAPAEVAEEMDRRERLLGMAEKLPKSGSEEG
jgi:phosphoribosyl-ATP pyrophosphohydrolase